MAMMSGGGEASAVGWYRYICTLVGLVPKFEVICCRVLVRALAEAIAAAASRLLKTNMSSYRWRIKYTLSVLYQFNYVRIYTYLPDRTRGFAILDGL